MGLKLVFAFTGHRQTGFHKQSASMGKLLSNAGVLDRCSYVPVKLTWNPINKSQLKQGHYPQILEHVGLLGPCKVPENFEQKGNPFEDTWPGLEHCEKGNRRTPISKRTRLDKSAIGALLNK